MTVTCFIEYKISPNQLDEFNEYAQNWLRIIPRCGGNLIGYYLPHEGTNYVAYGLIEFNSLAKYEEYRGVLKRDTAGKANFDFALQGGFILEEKRTFLSKVEAIRGAKS